MQYKDEFENILDQRSFEETNLDALNEKIITLAKQTPQAEFNSTLVRVNNSVKILAIMACFALGIFTGFSLEVNAISSEEIDYIYVEEGIL